MKMINSLRFNVKQIFFLTILHKSTKLFFRVEGNVLFSKIELPSKLFTRVNGLSSEIR